MTRYAKALTALVGAVSTWAATYYPDDPDVQKWLGLAIAVVTIFSVYVVPNDAPAGQPADPNISERGPVVKKKAPVKKAVAKKRAERGMTEGQFALMVAVAALVVALLAVYGHRWT